MRPSLLSRPRQPPPSPPPPLPLLLLLLLLLLFLLLLLLLHHLRRWRFLVAWPGTTAGVAEDGTASTIHEQAFAMVAGGVTHRSAVEAAAWAASPRELAPCASSWALRLLLLSWHAATTVSCPAASHQTLLPRTLALLRRCTTDAPPATTPCSFNGGR